MQQTRRYILEYLRDHSQATVDELAQMLDLTPVTVRHHLEILRQGELVSAPVVRHRATPGRPQHVYTLAPKAAAYFPNNYTELAATLLEQIKACTTPEAIRCIFEGMGRRVALAHISLPGQAPLAARMAQTVEFLNQRGYNARIEDAPGGPTLHTCQCPYQGLVAEHPELCLMDQVMTSTLLGEDILCTSRLVEGAPSCAYVANKQERVLNN